MPVDEAEVTLLDPQHTADDDDTLDDHKNNDNGIAGDPDATDGAEAPGPVNAAPLATRLAAILFYGGKHGGDARDILETFDFWALTTDIQQIAHAPVHKLVIAESEKEIEQRLAQRYEAPWGFTMLHREEREVRQSRPEIKTWSGATRNEYTWRYVAGWRVLSAPMLIGSVNSEKHLLSLCIQQRQFIIDEESMERLGGPKYLESRSYVLTGAGGEGIHRIRWNPLLWQQREHQAKKAETERRLCDTLPNYLLNDLGDCLNPSNWPSRHPFHGMLDGIKGKERGGGWRSVWRERAQYSIEKIVAYIRVNLRLTPHLRPWRGYRSGSGGSRENRTYRQILRDLLDHLHGIGRNKSKDYRFLTRWLGVEAKAMGLAIPEPPRMPWDMNAGKVKRPAGQ